MADITFQFIEGDIPSFEFQALPLVPKFQFELSTRGSTGAQGPQGEQGTAGTNGTNGTDGLNGARFVGFFSDDVDMAGGSWTNLPLYGSDGAPPRSAIVGLTVLVVEGDDFGVWTVTASGPSTPSTDIALNQLLSASAQGLIAAPFTMDGTTVAGVVVAAISSLAASDISYTGTGLTAGFGTVLAALNGFEGFTDNERHVRGYFAASVDPALFTGPVADIDQPITDDGQQVVKGDLVATLGDVDVNGDNWIAIVDNATGCWGFVPSSGPSTPVGASAWDNAISTNYLKGGSKIVCKSGRLGVFLGERTNGTFTGSRGGPDIFSDPYNGGEWVFIIGGSGSGDVVGPGSATNNAIALFDTITGKLLKDSAKTISIDGTLASNSDALIPTEKAVKTYADLMIPKSTGTTKGDLLIYTTSGVVARKAVGADGTVPLANSNETTGIGWYAPGSTHSFQTGTYTPNAPFVATTFAMAADRLYACKPFLVRKRRTFDRIGMMHVSGVAATGQIRIDICGITEVDGLVGTQLFGEYLLDITATGAGVSSSVVKNSGAISLTLDPGIYFPRCVAQFTVTAPTVNGRANDYPPIYPDAFTSGAGNTMPIQASVTGAIPTTWTPSSAVNTSPVVYLRAS